MDGDLAVAVTSDKWTVNRVEVRNDGAKQVGTRRSMKSVSYAETETINKTLVKKQVLAANMLCSLLTSDEADALDKELFHKVKLSETQI